LENRKAKVTCNPYAVVALSVDTKSTGRSFQVMAQSGIDKIPSGPKLDALTAEKVFGWKNVHKHEGSLVGKRRDKAGHWRRAKVPNYSTNPLHSYFGREPDEAARALGSIRKRTFQAYPLRKHSVRLGFAGSTLSGGNQSCGAIRPSHPVTRKTRLRTLPHATINEGET